jgi:hypothetical protein
MDATCATVQLASKPWLPEMILQSPNFSKFLQVCLYHMITGSLLHGSCLAYVRVTGFHYKFRCLLPAESSAAEETFSISNLNTSSASDFVGPHRLLTSSRQRGEFWAALLALLAAATSGRNDVTFSSNACPDDPVPNLTAGRFG